MFDILSRSRLTTEHEAADLLPGMIVTCTAGDPLWKMPRTASLLCDDVFAAQILTTPELATFATKSGPRRGTCKQYTFKAVISGKVRTVYVPAGQLVSAAGSLQDWMPACSPVLTGASA